MNEGIGKEFDDFKILDKYKKIKRLQMCFGCDYRCRAKDGHCPKWKNDRSWKKHRKNQIKKVA